MFPGNEKKENTNSFSINIFFLWKKKVISCLKFPELLVSTSFCHHFSISSQADLFLPSVKITWFSLSENQKHKQFLIFLQGCWGPENIPSYLTKKSKQKYTLQNLREKQIGLLRLGVSLLLPNSLQFQNPCLPDISDK